MPESLGKTLKGIREKKQLSLEEVSEKTRIPKKNLIIIEEDRLNEIESLFYRRGFVKSYAQFLGAMENDVVKKYLSGAPKKDEPVLVLEGERVPGDWFLRHRKYIGYGIAALLSAALLFFGFVQTKKLAGYLSTKCHSYAAAKKEKREEPKKKEELELKVIARSDVWIQVSSDGKLFFRGILRRGSQDIWRAKTKIELELGSAGDVKLSLNGKDVGSPGKKGEKKRIVVTKDGIK